MTAHTIAAAMARGELDEEEAYFVLRFAGHHGYRDAMRRLGSKGPLRRALGWFVWAGGWETPELLQWDQGLPPLRMTKSPLPLSLFGHRVTFYGWGEQVRLGGGYFVWSRCGHDAGKVYWSPDGTPQHERAVHLWPRRRRAL